MIIDFHTHTFPEKIAEKTIAKLQSGCHAEKYSDGTEKGLIEKMQSSGVDISVILPVATNPKQVEHVNEASSELNERHAADGLISFGCMHPDYENYKQELKRFSSLGLKGFKIHPPYQGYDIDDVKYLRILYEAASLDLIVVTHAGLDIGLPGVIKCSPEMTAHAMKEISGNTSYDFKFVLAHMGGWRNWDDVIRYHSDTGVYIDTAYSTGDIHPLSDGYWDGKDLSQLDEEGFISVCRAVGCDHVLFGTDSPWSDQKETISFIKGTVLTAEEKEKIFWQNARKLLKI